MPRVSFVVVSCDSGEWLPLCVERALQSKIECEVLVVDNQSRDGFPQALAKQHQANPAFRLMENNRNVGFGAACNQGLAAARGEWVVFLNPDCLIERDALPRLLAMADAHPAVGLWGVQTLTSNGAPELASQRVELSPRQVWVELWSRLLHWKSKNNSDASKPSADEVKRVDAISGALMAMRTEFARALGGFDTAYFLHAEDLDLCRRVRDAGQHVAIATSIHAVHHQGASSQRRPLFVSWHKTRGLVRYLNQHHAPSKIMRPMTNAALWLHFSLLAPWRAWQQWRRRLA